MKTIDIRIIWDEESRVYVAVGDKIGLVLESESYDRLLERVKIAAPEMMELYHIRDFDEIRIKTGRKSLPIPLKQYHQEKD